MRVIKFRAWNKHSKVMETVQDLYWFEEEHIRLANDPDSHYEIMQFTGILDRNKQEIYEGDIVRHGNAVTDIVEYIDGGFVLCLLSLSDVSRKEVIGNIYEHPERISECAQSRRRSIHDTDTKYLREWRVK